MMRPFFSFLLLVCSLTLGAGPRDSSKTFRLLEQGREMSSGKAEELEMQLRRKPNDEDARVRLLSYLTSRTDGNLASVREERSRHILWVIQNDPVDLIGFASVVTGVYRLNCQGDALADPDAFRQGLSLWRQHLEKNPANEAIRREAAQFAQYCAPEEAESLLQKGNDSAGLGRLYGSAVLGITGLDYGSSDPAGSEAALRNSPFAAKAMSILETSIDKELVAAAAYAVLQQGATLCADGKLDWDYTPIGRSLLVRARQTSPENLSLLTLPTERPARGERPPRTIRVGGNVMSNKLVHQPNPTYPAAARNSGIQGTVRLNVLVGLDGAILGLVPIDGPLELIGPAVDSVRQWKYQPTLLNGKPCYIATRIDVNFTLSR